MDDGSGAARRPGFKLSVAEYKGRAKETIEFQCETSNEVKIWVRAIEGVISSLRVNSPPRI